MPNSMFDDQGKLRIPETSSVKKALIKKHEVMIVKEAYCPKGHSLIYNEELFDGVPGLLMDFERENGERGTFVVSAVLGKYDKKVIKGTIKKSELINLLCPVCSEPFPVLSDCGGKAGSTLRILFLTPDADINQSVSFCNCVGCSNSALHASGKVIRASQLRAF